MVKILRRYVEVEILLPNEEDGLDRHYLYPTLCWFDCR